MRKYVLSIVSICVFVFTTKAQEGFENILFADLSDATKLTNGYVLPAAEGFIFGMSNGWYHTAKVHKPFGFDITIGANASFADDNHKSIDINALNLSTKISKSPLTSPTLFGENAVINAFEVTIPANSDPNINGGIHPELKRNFTMPDGIGEDLFLNGVPTPAVQIGLGLPYKFEVSVRFVPEIGGDETSAKLFGLGLKKEITNWFGVMDKTPLHISLMGAFTNMSVSNTIKDASITGISVTNGSATLELKSFTVQALASLNLPFINIYGGFGYINGTSSLNLDGTYNLNYQEAGQTYTKRLVDPLSLDHQANGFTTTAGLRLSLGFFKIFGSYSLQKYNTVNLGIAFSIR